MKKLLFMLACVCIVFASCAKRDDMTVTDEAESTVKTNAAATDINDAETTEDNVLLPSMADGDVITMSEVTPLTKEEEEKVVSFLHGQLGGNNPEEESFSFEFPLVGAVNIDGIDYYRGSWNMKVFDETGSEISSSCIMDFVLAKDFSVMSEIYEQDGVCTLFARDILH